MEHWEKESVREEIMNSWKKIKRERNQGEMMRGQRDMAKTLNEKEMGSWDKEVKKSKRRYVSSKEIKDHLHFAFSSAWAVISPLWRQTPAPTQNATNLKEWSWQIGLPEKWGCSFDWGEGLQTVGSPRQDKDITIIGCYTLPPLISDHGESGGWRKWDSKHGQIATTAKCSVTMNFNNVWNVMCMHQNNMGNSSVILSRSQKT